MTGDKKGADRRNQVAPVETNPAAGGQQPDAECSQCHTSQIDASDAVLPDQLGNKRNEEYKQVVQHPGPRDAGALDAKDETDVGQPQGAADNVYLISLIQFATVAAIAGLSCRAQRYGGHS